MSMYLPDSEGNWIPPEEKWRHVRYEHGKVDFTHEREWRASGDLDLKNLSSGIYVIVWSATEARELAKFSTPSGRQNYLDHSDGAHGRNGLKAVLHSPA